MRHGIILTLGTLLMFTCAEILTAQASAADRPVEQSYKYRYTKDLFYDADTNNDGFVSWDEARASSLAIERDRAGQKRFAAADLNDDGMLSLEEASKYKGFEIRHREEATRKVKEAKIQARDDTVVESPDVIEGRDDTVVDSPDTWEGASAREQKRERIEERHQHQRDHLRHKKMNTRRSPGDR